MSRVLALIAVVAMVAGPAHAQLQQEIRLLPIHPPNPPVDNPNLYRHVRVTFPTPEKRAENLTGLLELSSEQKSKVLALLVDQDKETSALWHDESLSAAARGQKIDELRDATVNKIRGVLDEQQRKKYDSIAPPRPAPKRIELGPDVTVPY